MGLYVFRECMGLIILALNKGLSVNHSSLPQMRSGGDI